MTKRDKLLKKIRSNPKAVTFEELRSLLEGFGFELLRVSGSHYIFLGTIDGEEILLVIPFRRGHLDPNYVRKALEAIARIEASAQDDDTE